MPIKVIPSHPSSDGAGVKIQRTHGFQNNALDPFLMLDEIRSDNPDDYGAGFPSHPHRGIETLTYMRNGGFVHQDHMGNRGEISSGESQWMSAGRGVIHSEMPLQKDGFMHGFQLWINLPAADKMKAADYRDLKQSELPWQPLGNDNDNIEIKVMAGHFDISGTRYQGPLQSLPGNAAVADLRLSAGTELMIDDLNSKTLLIYVYEGEITVDGKAVSVQSMVKVTDQQELSLSSPSAGVLLLSGIPLGEPVAHYGPFVMNTQQEIEQAISDYQQGILTD
ncbi:pirin family protein [Amphritea sp. HPY]|uniref:pirin family protein n=1 Tax=Amphritea sp. HPY TaxID=3421652 RepID=UPI003D7CDBF0